ncbi:MAG: polyphosphate polymerase domain-containing protein [Bacteroidales bacterium]|nr:polyphosphate polymerase domain-containing protein [Bacteroidales bacterium]
MNPEILDIVNAMPPITLDEMKDVKLMNRIDTKFLVTSNELIAILKGIRDRYYAQEVEGNRLSPYSTVYYDTPDLKMYTIHHDRHLVRDKVRVRTYVDSQLTFCEVKHKNNKGRTKKKRIEVRPGTDVTKDPETVSFLTEKQPYPVESLSPNLETAFDRFTLVNFEKTERLTIDCNLHFNNFVSGAKASMDPLVIMELKQDGRARSLLKEVLFDLRIKPYKISKYCIGTAMTRPEVKQNRFKKKIRRINKLQTSSI